MANRFRVNTTEFSDSSTINSGQLIDANGLLSLDWNTKTVLGVPNTKSITTSGYFNILPVYSTGQFANSQISSGFASVLLMSGIPLLVKQGNDTQLYGDNGQIFLQNIYTVNGANSGEFNYETELTAFNSGGVVCFVTLDATNDGQILLGTSANQTTMTISGGQVGILNSSPQFPLDVALIGNSTGIFTIKTLDIPTLAGGAASDLHIKGGLGNVGAGGKIIIDAGDDSQGYVGQNVILLNSNPFYPGAGYGSVGIGNNNPQYTLDVSGSGRFTNGIYGGIYSPISKVSGNFNIISTGSIYLINTTISGATGIFPNASGLAGYSFTIKDWRGNAGNHNIILSGTNNQTFDGSSSYTMNINYMALDFLSDGQNWCIV